MPAWWCQNLNPDNSYAPWTKRFRERFGMHFAWDPADQAPPFVWADGNVTSNVGPNRAMINSSTRWLRRTRSM